MLKNTYMEVHIFSAASARHNPRIQTSIQTNVDYVISSNNDKHGPIFSAADAIKKYLIHTNHGFLYKLIKRSICSLPQAPTIIAKYKIIIIITYYNNLLSMLTRN